VRRYHVGSLVVIDDRETGRAPAGIITDRDIVVAVVALGLDPEAIRVEDVMSREMFTVGENAGVAETAELMRMKGIRRLPVTDRGGALVGIVAADDLLSLLSEEMSALATMVSREHKREAARKLESAHPRLMRCHVSVERPHRHKEQGNLFNVRLALHLPGDEIVVNRDAHEDVYVTLRDAFSAARRQLEDHARKARGDVKQHAGRPA